jgi:ABC-2 type transport system permease protein
MTATTRPAPPRMPSIGRVLAAQIGYQARLLASGRAVTIGIGLPIILLIASHQSHTHTTDADVAQYAVFGLTLTAWNTYGVRLVAAREGGILKRWWATPLPRWCYFLGRILATVAVATVAGAATVAAGVLLYNVHLTVSGALGALMVFVLGSFAWAAVATALTAIVPTLEAAAPTFLVTYFPVIIISGVFGAISEPHWLSTIASYLPAQPLAHAVGIALGHTAGHAWLPARDLVVLAAWAIAGMAIAVVTFRWEPHRPTQRRPARPSRQTSHTDPGTDSSFSDSSASTAATTPPMQSGATTTSHA